MHGLFPLYHPLIIPLVPVKCIKGDKGNAKVNYELRIINYELVIMLDEGTFEP